MSADGVDWERLVQYTEEVYALLVELQNIPGFLQGDTMQGMTHTLEMLFNAVGERNIDV